MSATDELEHYMTACSRLKAENVRLQDGYDGLKFFYNEQHDKLLQLQERVEELEWQLEVKLQDEFQYARKIELHVNRERDVYKALAEAKIAALECINTDDEQELRATALTMVESGLAQSESVAREVVYVMALNAWVRYSVSSKPSKELLSEALRLTDDALADTPWASSAAADEGRG